MLQSDRSEPTVIPYIYAEAEEGLAEPTTDSKPAAPSLARAFESAQGGIKDDTIVKRLRKDGLDETERNTTLSQERDTADQINKLTPKPPRREQTLSEALHDVIPEEEPGMRADDIPDSLQEFDPDDVAAAMLHFGLEESDLDDHRWISALRDWLKTIVEADPDVAEEEERYDPEETEDGEKDPTEAAKPEEKKTDLPIPQSVQEYVGNDPDKLKVLNDHIQATYQRAASMNDPVMTDVFVRGLAGVLETPEERLPMLKETVDVLAYGGYALVEAAVPKLLPALVTEYMRQNFAPILEHFAPGLQESHITRTCEGIWSDVCGSEEFKDAGLPKFGTPEFQEVAKTVHEKNPWLNDFDPKGPDGKQLPVLQALRVKAELTARLLAGERISPAKLAQHVAEALAKGKKTAESATRRVSASRALKGGRTQGAIGRQESDRQSLMDAWKEGGGGGAI